MKKHQPNIKPKLEHFYSRNSVNVLNKAFLLIAFFTLMMSLPSTLMAQETSETVYKDWIFLGESKNHVDVSTRIVKCSEASANQVHLFIFNEGSESNDIKFKVTITDNESGKSFDAAISHKVDRAEMIKATCDNVKSLNDLKITLPADYNPNNLTLTINFN